MTFLVSTTTDTIPGKTTIGGYIINLLAFFFLDMGHFTFSNRLLPLS